MISEPEAFVYCWNKTNGEYYYGAHLGDLDDHYAGTGVVFKRKFGGYRKSQCINPNEWERTILFRGTRKECEDYERDLVSSQMVEQPDCLNLVPGGQGAVRMMGDDNPARRPEVREKMSQSHSGKVLTEVHKKAISDSGKGKKHSEETKVKLSTQKLGSNNPMFGKLPANSKLTDDQVREIRTAFDNHNGSLWGFSSKFTEKFNISKSAFYRVARRKTYANITD